MCAKAWSLFQPYLLGKRVEGFATVSSSGFKTIASESKSLCLFKTNLLFQNLYRALMCAPLCKNQSMQGITSSQFTTQKLLCNMQNRKQQTLACLLCFRKTKKMSTPISMK